MKIVKKDVGMPASGEFKTYRKTALAQIAGPYAPPVQVETQEGPALISTEPCYIAVDVEGHPYPIKASVFEASYELVPPDADPGYPEGAGAEEPTPPPDGSGTFTAAQVKEIAAQASGATSAVFMKEAPSLVMPSEAMDEAVSNVLNNFGVDA